MDWFVRAFLKASLVWLSLAVLLALAMAFVPTLTVYRTAHLHMALLGFVGQMIYGVALHVVPRFFGQPLVYRRLAELQFWAAQVGLSALALGFISRIHGAPWAAGLIASGGLASALGAGCFVVNIWRTIDASPMSAVHQRGGRALTTLPQQDAH
jgi:hypothetical protein